MHPKAAAPILGVTCLIWLAMVSFMAVRFNVPSADGILYSLPLAQAKHPFDLGVPFLNDFEGYGSSWGHQWPGSMWLRALIFMMLPYSRMADVVVLSLFQLLAALTAGGLVWRATGKVVPALAALVLILSDRLLLLDCAGNRFESLAVAAVLLLFANSATDFGRRYKVWRWLTCVVAFLCPTLHAYGLALGILILGYDFFAIRSQPGGTYAEWAARLGAFLLGCAALAGWFLAQPEAWRQLAANIELQKSFSQNWNSVMAGLSNYRLQGGVILWGAGLLSSGLLIFGWPSGADKERILIDPAWRILAPALFISVIVIHTLTRCENFSYLAIGTPFAAMLICIATTKSAEAFPRFIRWVPVAALLALTALHATLHPYRLLQFIKAGMPDFDTAYAEVLRETPPNRTVFIPHPMWPVAIRDQAHTIRWFTFPIASQRSVRERYEHHAYASVKPGDVLIIENGGAGQADRFGLYPTFPTVPPDPALWSHIRDHKQLYPGATTWGIDLSVYEYRAGKPPTSR